MAFARHSRLRQVPEPRLIPDEIKQLAARWRDAISRLADDPDAPLPS
jgi:hypothetical protein